MSFEQKIPDHLWELRKKQDDLVRQKASLIHDCDCGYCESYGDVVTDENQKLYDDIEQQVKEIGKAIQAIHDHAALHNVEVPVPK